MAVVFGFLLVLLFISPGSASANMALPASSYLFSSLSVFLTMLAGDLIVLKLFWKSLGLQLNLKKFLISLLLVLVAGVLADYVAVKLTAFSLDSVYSGNAGTFSYEYATLNRITGDFLILLRPTEFYRISTYLGNFVNVNFPEYHQPFSIIMVGVWSLTLITLFNLLQKLVLGLTWKQTLILALTLGLLTNPIIPFNLWLVLTWFLGIIFWYWVVKKKT